MAQIFGAFAREVFTPMVAQLTAVPTAERRRLLDEIRRRLDIVEDVIATEEAAGLPRSKPSRQPRFRILKPTTISPRTTTVSVAISGAACASWCCSKSWGATRRPFPSSNS